MVDDELDLVERAKSDPKAFGALYESHVDGVYRYLYARLGNAADAQDVTAEVFVKALRGIGRYRHQGRPFAAWLHQIARNALADHFRRGPMGQELGEDTVDLAVSVEGTAIRNLEVEAIWRRVDRLPPQQRAAMILRFGSDSNCRETAALMGKSEAAVKLLIYRATVRLRSDMAPARTDEPARSALAVS